MKPAGVLALQGDFEAHRVALERAGMPAILVRRPEELEGLSGLVIPGGESTALLKLMEGSEFPGALRRFAATGRALFGTCAGAILLAREVRGPAQTSFGLIDIAIERNAYGRQAESFETGRGWWGPRPAREGESAGSDLELVLIRAPRIVTWGPRVRVLAWHGEDPVLVRQGQILAGTFHPELGKCLKVHEYFVGLARQTHEDKVTPRSVPLEPIEGTSP